MTNNNEDLNRLNSLVASWRDALAATEPELCAALAKDPAVAAAMKNLRGALSAQRELTDLLEVEALERFRSNKQLDQLAQSSLKDAAGVVRRASTDLAAAVRDARSAKEKAAVADTVTRVAALLSKHPEN